MARVQAEIRSKLIPEGPQVIRHLALPSQGKSKEWIVTEMQRMDDESEHSNRWKAGKISGAIYRTYHFGYKTTEALI